MSSLQTSFLNRNQIKYYYNIAGGFKIWYCYCVTLLYSQMLKVKSQTERISMWNREFNSVLKKKKILLKYTSEYVSIILTKEKKRKEKKRIDSTSKYFLYRYFYLINFYDFSLLFWMYVKCFSSIFTLCLTIQLLRAI